MMNKQKRHNKRLSNKLPPGITPLHTAAARGIPIVFAYYYYRAYVDYVVNTRYFVTYCLLLVQLYCRPAYYY